MRNVLNTEKFCAIFLPPVIFILLAGCFQNSTVNNTPTLSTTLQPIHGSPTQKPTIAPSATVTFTPTPDSGLTPSCPPILKDALKDSGASGFLVTDGQIFDIRSGEKQLLDDPGYYYAGSPDGKHFSYISYIGENRYLVIQSTNGEKKKILWKKDWVNIFPPAWLDNEHLIFNGDRRPIYSVIVYDPFVVQKNELLSEYPDMMPNPNGIDDLFFQSLNVVYDDTLSFALYPQQIFDASATTSFSLVLFDRNKKEVLASLPDLNYFSNLPIWSAARQQFVVAVGMDRKRWLEDLYSIDTGGKIVQLTNFSKSFPEENISESSLSPDGKFLAFWVTFEPQVQNQTNQFFLLDLNSKKITQYCFIARQQTKAIWSPDGKYLALRIEQAGKGQMIVLDIGRENAFNVGEDGEFNTASVAPLAWMVDNQ